MIFSSSGRTKDVDDIPMLLTCYFIYIQKVSGCPLRDLGLLSFRSVDMTNVNIPSIFVKIDILMFPLYSTQNEFCSWRT